MSRKAHLRNILILILVLLGGLYWYLSSPDKARQDVLDLSGPAPNLQPMRTERFPTIQIAKIIGWKTGETPTPAKGMTVKAFASGLDHPRWLYELPNGDVLVAETSAPQRETQGFTDWVARNLISKAGGADKPANRIALLRDADGDGVAETRHVLLSGLNSPLGMAFREDKLYVANTDAVLAFPFKPGETRIEAKGEKIMDLPAGLPNNHWTRNLAISPDGESLMVTIGSNSNIGENGMESEKDRAQIKQYVFKTGKARVFGYGLRNPTGLAFHPASGILWTTVNERDMLGSDGPPDYLTSVNFGTFYGWPYTYWGKNEDFRVPQDRPELLQYTKRPDYALGAHVAALGVAFNPGLTFGPQFQHGAFVGLHGSWNRSPPSGYKVVYVPFTPKGFPTMAKPVDVLTGFLTADGKAKGRPAGVIMAKDGALLVADDAGNVIWRVQGAAPQKAPAS
jgi:glucose/arabinose dehydrogenase